MANTVVDLRNLDVGAANEELADELASLETCREVLCIASSVESVLSHSLYVERGEPVTWRTLALSPSEVLLALRRGRCQPPASESVLNFMQKDHARIHALVDATIEAAEQGEAQTFTAIVGLLSRLLRRHIEVEESLIIPVIGARHGQPRGPASVLREEHLVVLNNLEFLEAEAMGLQGPTGEAIVRARGLDRTLKLHGDREEELVYELADKILDEEERASLIDFCQALD